MKKKTYFYQLKIILVLIVIQSTCLIRAQNAVVIPNPNALGAKAFCACNILVGNTNAACVFPKETRIVIKNGNIDEIQAFYDKDVSLDGISEAVNLQNINCEVANMHQKHFRMWSVKSKTIAIQLREYKGHKLLFDGGDILEGAGDKLLIYTQVTARKK